MRCAPGIPPLPSPMDLADATASQADGYAKFKFEWFFPTTPANTLQMRVRPTAERRPFCASMILFRGGGSLTRPSGDRADVWC